jgi:thioesterase domain-containing protein
MLVPFHPSGSQPPLFFVHGNNGIMPVGRLFARILGPEQPLYAIHANGFDGSPPRESVAEMVQDYVAEIMEAAPNGPLIIGGQCWGTLVALEVARALSAKGRAIGPVILLDPPRVPSGKGAEQLDSEMSRQLYSYVQGLMLKLASVPYYDVPFDARDPDQLHIATQTGIATVAAISRFSPKPFLGATQLVLSSDLAPSFFGPAAHWKKILPNPPTVHAIPCGHLELVGSRRHEVTRLIKYILGEAFPRARDFQEPQRAETLESSDAT